VIGFRHRRQAIPYLPPSEMKSLYGSITKSAVMSLSNDLFAMHSPTDAATKVDSQTPVDAQTYQSSVQQSGVDWRPFLICFRGLPRAARCVEQ
jgi:hypothetical protein